MSVASNHKLGELYWVENYPCLLESLAEQTPGMHALDVADLLDELDQETMRATEPGECHDYSDFALIKLYLNEFV